MLYLYSGYALRDGDYSEFSLLAAYLFDADECVKPITTSVYLPVCGFMRIFD